MLAADDTWTYLNTLPASKRRIPSSSFCVESLAATVVIHEPLPRNGPEAMLFLYPYRQFPCGWGVPLSLSRVPYYVRCGRGAVGVGCESPNRSQCTAITTGYE